jgi:N utilization substance protein A
MNKDLIAVFEYLERERGIKREVVLEAIRESLEIAAKKSVHGAENVIVSIHPKTGEIEVFCDKKVVQKVLNPVREVSVKDALLLNPEAVLGQIMAVTVTPKDFGRIAAQKARGIIQQKLRGAERDVIHEEYRHRIGELVSGTVKRIGRGNTLIVDLGKVEGVIPLKHYPITEKYNVGDRVLALLFEVRDTEMGGAEVVLTRSHPDFVRQLFSQEVPEINDGLVTIENIVREPGFRTKIIVRSADIKVDPVGACIGMRGVRVKNICRELMNEKIDIVPYSADRFELLQNALSPIEIRNFRVSDEGRHLYVVVDDDQFASAIGKKGLNVRLIGQLLDVELDIQKISDFRRIQSLERANLAASNNPLLDKPLNEIEGLNPLIVDQLMAETENDYKTARKVLEVPLDKLGEVLHSLELADRLQEQIMKGVTLDQKPEVDN